MVARSALTLTQASVARKSRDELRYVRLTEPQREFVSCDAREAAWVDANQLGKSYAGAFDVIHRCRGTHPFQRTRNPPIKVLVASTSLDQMEPLMEKLWMLAPKDELHPKCGYDPGRGITGKPPRLVFSKGPGRGSRILFATYKQGAGRVAGSTLDHAMLDEPPPESFWEEVLPRLLRLNGTARFLLTPVPGMPDITWLRKKCEGADGIGPSTRYFNWHLKPEHTLREGDPTPALTQAMIDAFEASLPERVRAMRTRGAWEQIAAGGWLSAFDRTKHVRVVRLEDWRTAKIVVGIDHGTAEGKQCAMLQLVLDGHTDRPRVAYLDETVSEGFTTPEHDAVEILAMLRRWGLHYNHVDVWIGDVATGSQRHQVRKSNTHIRHELARLLGKPASQIRQFAEPVKYAQSLTDGLHLMNTLFSRVDEMGEPMAVVDPRCVTFIDACERFDGGKWHPLKDVLDAGRYGTEAGITGQVVPILSTRY